MKKIAIVGVDGSGKTVLMTALGDKYENPDEFGLFLSPENADAFGYVKLQMDRMRSGMWPASTIAGKSSVLEWGLFRKANGANARLCDLSFLDFSGEIYRLAFGSKNDHDAAQYEDVEIREGINELRQHVKAADALAVLVNLKDIISGNAANPRTCEAMWLSKSILDYATRELHTPNVALVFTQADAYRETISSCGGVRGAYERYLPHVANIYPDMRLLAVSAVNMTFPDENGLPCPVAGFRSEGLDDLMEWIVSTVPGCETLISDVRQAPLRLRQKTEELQLRYLDSLAADTGERRALLDDADSAIDEMEKAIAAYPDAMNPSAADFMRNQMEGLRRFEAAYDQLCAETRDKDAAGVVQAVEALASVDDIAAKKRNEIVEILASKNRMALAQATARRRRRCWMVAFVLLLIAGAGAGAYGYRVHLERQKELQRQESARREAEEERRLAAEEEASKPKIARGWSYEMRKGHKIAVWKPGAYHSQTTNLKADQEIDKWISTRPGYVWTYGTNTDWKVGVPYPGNPHCISSKEANNWHAAEGYKWAKPDEAGNFDVVWNSSWLSADGSKRATSQEGVFEEKISCSSCSGRGKVSAKRTCSNCNGTKRVSSSSTCSRCDGSGRINESSSCSRCDGSGIYERSCPDCGPLNDRYGNYIAHGQVCDNCGGRGVVAYNGRGSIGDAFIAAGMQLQGQQPVVNCSKCNGYGAYHHSICGQTGRLRETCSRCDGAGSYSSSRNCPKCYGRGTVSENGRCYHCDSDGREDVSVACQTCNGSGKVWR